MPKLQRVVTVYHMDWVALGCGRWIDNKVQEGCGEMVDKKNWKTIERKNK